MPRHLLIADDDPVSLRILERSLARPDYLIHTATDGAQALEHLQRAPCDLLLTDLYMPGLNGVELTQAVRAIPRHAHLPIGLVTYETDHAIRHEAKLAGVDFFIEKPVNVAHLRRCVLAAGEVPPPAQAAGH